MRFNRRLGTGAMDNEERRQMLGRVLPGLDVLFANTCSDVRNDDTWRARSIGDDRGH